jgi:hypothetical protein
MFDNTPSAQQLYTANPRGLSTRHEATGHAFGNRQARVSSLDITAGIVAALMILGPLLAGAMIMHR